VWRKQPCECRGLQHPPNTPPPPPLDSPWLLVHCAPAAPLLTHSFFPFTALNLIPAEDKKDYVEAVRIAPLLIKTESHPIKFLRSRDFNPWTAAMALVLYWKYRRQLFGRRWLLTLDDTGSGAMDETKAVQTQGNTLIQLIPSMPGVGPALTREHLQAQRLAWRMVKEALPMRPRSSIFFQRGEKGNLQHSFSHCLQQSVFGIFGKGLIELVQVHSAKEAAAHFVEKGLPTEVLPAHHGRTWSYTSLFDWKTVVQTEDDIGKFVKIPWLQEGLLSEDRSRYKDMNALYARRSYQRRKLRDSEATDTVKDLQDDNERLKHENAQLEHLLQQAVAIVTRHTALVQVSAQSDQPFEDRGDPLPH
jgi:hypothetical protein